MTALKEQGRRYAIVDAVTDAHLLAIGEAAARHALITGGSGIAMGLPENFRRAGLLRATRMPARCRRLRDRPRCSPARARARRCAQVATAREQVPTLELDPLATPDAAALARQALDWAAGQLGDTPVVIAASAPPDRVAALQARLGREAAGALVEQALARDRRGPGRARGAPAGGRGRRDGGRGGRGTRRAAAADRRRDRPRRALDPCRGHRPGAASGAEVGQFRRPGFLHPKRSRPADRPEAPRPFAKKCGRVMGRSIDDQKAFRLFRRDPLCRRRSATAPATPAPWRPLPMRPRIRQSSTTRTPNEHCRHCLIGDAGDSTINSAH